MKCWSIAGFVKWDWWEGGEFVIFEINQYLFQKGPELKTWICLNPTNCFLFGRSRKYFLEGMHLGIGNCFARTTRGGVLSGIRETPCYLTESLYNHVSVQPADTPENMEIIWIRESLQNNTRVQVFKHDCLLSKCMDLKVDDCSGQQQAGTIS